MRRLTISADKIPIKLLDKLYKQGCELDVKSNILILAEWEDNRWIQLRHI